MSDDLPRWGPRFGDDVYPDGRPMYWDRQGKPMSHDAWVATFENEEIYMSSRRVDEDAFVIDEQPVWVSTVWLGIDHSFGFGGPPIIFETKIFGGTWDDAQMRYATELSAQEGHARTVADLAAGSVPWFMRDDESEEANSGPAQQD